MRSYPSPSFRRLLRLLPLISFVMVCGLAGAVAQRYQPYLGIFDSLGLPKWLEVAESLSFLVVLIRCFQRDDFRPTFHLALLCAMYPMLCFLRAVLGPPDSVFADAATQVDAFISGSCAFVCAVAPILLAVAMLWPSAIRIKLARAPG
jgi:hypothetical protein